MGRVTAFSHSSSYSLSDISAILCAEEAPAQESDDCPGAPLNADEPAKEVNEGSDVPPPAQPPPPPPPPTSTYYDKSKSFFDNISCEGSTR